MTAGTKWYDQPPRPLEDESDYLFEIHRQTAQLVDEFLDFRKKQETVNEVLFEDLGELKGRVSLVEERMGGIEERMGGIEGRMDGLETRMGGIEGRMDRLESDNTEIKATLQLILNKLE